MTPLWLGELPRCLSDLPTKRVSIPDESAEPAAAAFQIRCRACEGDSFRFSEVLHGESSTGILAQCLQCQADNEVFDGMVHGYEGEQGYTDHLKGPRSARPLVWFDGTSPEASGLAAVFPYNTDPDELDEIANELNLRPVDLFDWFVLAGNLKKEGSPEGSRVTIWDRECA